MNKSILVIKYDVYRKFYISCEMQDGNILRKMKAANEGANSMRMYSYHSQENILNKKNTIKRLMF